MWTFEVTIVNKGMSQTGKYTASGHSREAAKISLYNTLLPLNEAVIIE